MFAQSSLLFYSYIFVSSFPMFPDFPGMTDHEGWMDLLQALRVPLLGIPGIGETGMIQLLESNAWW